MADGKYYQNPVIYDETGDWFICFDDEDPVEFVIRKNVISSSRKDREREILERLEVLGISAKIINSKPTGQRNFTCMYDKPKQVIYLDAISADLELLNRIPFNSIKFKADSIHNNIDHVSQYTLYDPEYWKENKN
jgi:hypothetical protein